MIYKASHSTDEFMFRSFDIHSKIFKRKNLRQYFMISSGTNQFSMPSFWKESLSKEIESDFLYRWYTGSDGFQCMTSAIKIYEDYISSCNKNKLERSNRKVCLATGGSGAASLTFEYIKKTYSECRVILVGMNYSLYERLSKKYGFQILELCGKEDPYSLPSAEDFIELTTIDNVKDIFVFSLPNNPSGEIYSYDEFSAIVDIISKSNGFILIDTVCNIIVSEKEAVFWEQVITEYNMWHSCAVVSSFSKTDAVAGLRLGYVYGEKKLIDVCSVINADSIMNPPTFPAFAIVITCLFRCLYINSVTIKSPCMDAKLKRLYRTVFYMTTAIVTERMKEYTEKIFDNIDCYYTQYISEQLENEKIMQKNYINTIDMLGTSADYVSKMEGGFNFFIRFKNPLCYDELTLIENLLYETGVAILTESSFSIRNVDNLRYMIRFSIACPETQYNAALLRMADYLKNGDII